MTKVKMLKTQKGSPDGINVKVYAEGQEYDVNESLVDAFIEDGACELVEEKKAHNPVKENKAIESVAENKSSPKKKARKKK